jgi:response regulator of citrate/malate metabolism
MTKLNIYIVEDEQILATLLKYTLQSMGHRVCGMAESYTEVVKTLGNSGADLIISDIMLKGNETGIDIAKYNRATLNLPFVFLSSVSDKELVDDAMSTSPVAYLKKPVTKAALNNAIANYNITAS